MSNRSFLSISLGTLAFLLNTTAAVAQKQIVVEQVISEMSKGMQTGFEVLVPEASYKQLDNELSKYLRKGSKSRTEEINGELYIAGAVNKNISPEPFKIYVKHREVNDGVQLTAFFTPDDTLFFSVAYNPETAAAIKKYLRDFAVEQYRKSANEDLVLQQRKLAAMENELETLIKEKQRSEKNINEALRSIENNKSKIISAAKQDTSKASEIMNQREIVNRLKGTGGDEEKMARKNLKNLESDKRKIEKEKENLARETDNLQIRIENETRSIERNKDKQEEKKKEIEKQKDKVKDFQKKLEDIR